MFGFYHMKFVLNSKFEFHQHPVVRIVPLIGLQGEQGEAGVGQRLVFVKDSYM